MGIKIIYRIDSGKLKGYTVRKSKNGLYDLYSSNGVSQANSSYNSLKELEDYIKLKY